MSKENIAISRVQNVLAEGMYQGNMHTCLRAAGRLAGGFKAGGTITASDVDCLKQQAVSRCIDAKLGSRTFDKAVQDGAAEPVSIEDFAPIEGAREIGWDEPLVRRGSRASAVSKLVPGEIQIDKPTPQYVKVVDSSWLSAADIPPAPEQKGWQAENFCRYLSNMFRPDETVGLCLTTFTRQTDDGVKHIPDGGVWDRTAGELIALVKKRKGDLGAVLGDANIDAGAWVRINPLDGQGIKDDNVTSYRHTLIEADGQDLGKQLQVIRDLKLPCACIVHSGKKSIHALVLVGAKNLEEYRARVTYLHGVANANGLKADPACKNPSRLSRLPGFVRGEMKQYIIDDACGLSDWDEWVEWIEDQKDELPDFETLDNYDFNNLPPMREEIIQGILRKGHKLTLTGPSKAGKSFDLLELVAAIASGGKWHGWQCIKGKALYVNLEVDKISALYRQRDIFVAKKIPFEMRANIDYWNLRGKNKTLDKLAPKLIRRAMKQGYSIIILDPIYKILTGDENNAADMAEFTGLFDTITEQLQCAVVCCHHHSKGAQGSKRSADRGSGSGVFSRDPDAILDLIELNITPDVRKQLSRFRDCQVLISTAKECGIDMDDYGEDEIEQPDSLFQRLTVEHSEHADLFRAKRSAMFKSSRLASAWRIEATLREFEKPDFTHCWFQWPIHIEDDTGMLLDLKAEGEEPPWKAKKESVSQQKAEKKKAKDEAKAAEKLAKEEKAEQEAVKMRARLLKAIEKAGGFGVATKGDIEISMNLSESQTRTLLVKNDIISRLVEGKGRTRALFGTL